ncbi:MAG: oligosaccharide flippase family protein [Terracidiphilus sp.]
MQFGSGEAVGRLCTLGLYAFTTRRFGVEVFGSVALAQTVANYLTYSSDQGYKLIGARLVARNRNLGPHLIRFIVPRRVFLATLACLCGCIYALWGPMPAASRTITAVFAIAVIPSSFALDWILWGMGSFNLLSGWKALVSVAATGIAIAGMLLTAHPLWSISVGNLVAAVVGSALLWRFASAQWNLRSSEISPVEVEMVRSELRTPRVLTLGTSNLLNLVFTNSDLLLLAAMTNATEVGHYSSATKLLFVIFSAYYLLTNTLYPAFSRIMDIHKLKKYLLLALGIMFVLGSLLAAFIAYFSQQILSLMYGPGFDAHRLLQILVIALPFELGVSLLATALASQGYESILLRCLLMASVLNVSLNLHFIPRYGATAAAWSTVASYGTLFGLYVFFLCRLGPREVTFCTEVTV